MRSFLAAGLLLLTLLPIDGQDYPYVYQKFAGTFPLGDGAAATVALLYNPTAASVDTAGNVYILDSLNFRIRKVTPSGTISTVAQLGTAATDMKRAADGTFYLTAPTLVFKVSSDGTATILAGDGTIGSSPDGTVAASAKLSLYLGGVALDNAGLVYFAEDHRIRRITADGKLETVAGSSVAGFQEGAAATAKFTYPFGLTFDPSGALYIADYGNNRIRKLASGTVSTIAGTGVVGFTLGGTGTASMIGAPLGLTLDSSGNLYFVDATYFFIYKLTAANNLTLFAGSGDFAYTDGAALGTYLFGAVNVAVDAAGALYVAEKTTHRVRKIANGNTTTFAGRLHFAGDGGPAASALLNVPLDTTLGSQGSVLILDSQNFRIRRVGSNATISTLAGNGVPTLPAEGAQAASASLPLAISAVAADKPGNVYVAVTDPSQYGAKILRISTAGIVTTFAGTGAASSSGDGGLATVASFRYISGMALDDAGALYLADSLDGRVRKIGANGIASSFAGTGTAGFSGDSGPAATARLSIAGGGPLAVDASGNVYIGDSGNRRVRRVTPGGIISTYAGNGTQGAPTNGAQASASPFDAPSSLSVDAAGNLYIASNIYQHIYKVGTSGVIRTIAGGGTDAVAAGVAAATTLGFRATGVDVDPSGDLYATDPLGNVVWKLILNS
ncbi:MAG: hypothetical protein ABI995_14325, partial [Acidobacteriota bacterium]